MADTDALHSALDSTRREYLDEFADRFVELTELWQTWERNEDRSALVSLHELASTIVDTSGTLDLVEICHAARRLERLLASVLDSSDHPTLEQAAQIRITVDAVRGVVEVPQQSEHTHEPTLPQIAPHVKPAASEALDNPDLIYLVGESEASAQTLTTQLRYYGYTVRPFERMADLEDDVIGGRPAALIINVDLIAEVSTEEAFIDALHAQFGPPPPVLFLSDADEFEIRLKAVRAGGSAYFIRPVKIRHLVNKLETLTERSTPKPHRIFIVDDDPVLAEYYTFVFEQYGMEAISASDPMQAMSPLVEFAPDLILMDVQMPACSGLELAAVIRQQPAFDSIPIVFLSRERQSEQYVKALALGGDAYLTKPLSTDRLISSVIARAQRSRMVRTQNVYDGLTGLMNHTLIKEYLRIELKRAQREETPLSFVVLDVDEFSAVNDTYGYLIGDRVLKSLADLLKKRLRETDVVGRYGGEEFAIILPNTTQANAGRVLDEIRTHWAKMRHESNGETFSVTFSCGIAGAPPYETAADLNKAAEAALRMAKESGRNRVQFAMHQD